MRLKTYDKDNIPPRIIAVIRSTYLTNENFTPETAKKASPAAEARSGRARNTLQNYLLRTLST
jgi:hypothetical protein